jgi:hypothetical protein
MLQSQQQGPGREFGVFAIGEVFHNDLLRRGERYASFFRLQHRDAVPLTLAPINATA